MNRYSQLLIICVGALTITGCALETPYLDAHFGQATEQSQMTQAVQDNQANPSMRMNAQALHNGMVNYMGDKSAPKAIPGVLGGASGGGSGQ